MLLAFFVNESLWDYDIVDINNDINCTPPQLVWYDSHLSY